MCMSKLFSNYSITVVHCNKSIYNIIIFVLCMWFQKRRHRKDRNFSCRQDGPSLVASGSVSSALVDHCRVLPYQRCQIIRKGNPQTLFRITIWEPCLHRKEKLVSFSSFSSLPGRIFHSNIPLRYIAYPVGSWGHARWCHRRSYIFHCTRVEQTFGSKSKTKFHTHNKDI